MTIFVDPHCVADRGYDDADCPWCGAVRGEFCREGCPAAAAEEADR
jgi:hypothetical protein